MKIKCMLCNNEYNLITSHHLKLHNMTTSEYAEKFGKDSLSSPERKRQASERMSGENNTNYKGGIYINRPKKDLNIECKECGQKFHNRITHTHLNRHNMTTYDYKEKYGTDSLLSVEYRENKKKTALEKNKPRRIDRKLSDEEKENLKEKALERHRKWRENGTNPLKGTTLPDDVKRKISNSIKEYAKNNPEEMSRRGSLSIETRKKNGYDIAFFRGKKHTEETKRKIIKTTEKARELRKKETREKNAIIIQEAGYEIIDIDEKFWFYTLKCDNCNQFITTTVQNFHPSKYKNIKCSACPTMEYKKSKAELEVLQFVKDLLPNSEIISGDKTIISPKELDIFIKDKNLAIEYCGLNCHGENPIDKRFTNQGKPPNYHVNKMIGCNDKNIDLITIFSDEWCDKKDIVKNILKSKLGIYSEKIYARKCIVKEITSKEANEFIENNHIQGKGRSHVRLGLFHENILISVMTFNKGDITHKSDDWEINRYAVLNNIIVLGGAEKLFKYYIKNYNPVKVVSYSDLRYFKGNVYKKLGFELEKTTSPGYWYIKANKKYHRYALRKNKNDDINLTEWENRKLQDWDRIWDCGNTRWVWNKE